MLILLPPSETKRSGGEAVPLDWSKLSFTGLTSQRRELAEALLRLSDEPERAWSALKLGRTQRGEIERNRQLLLSPTLPAMDRYTGVLFDALDAATLSVSQRSFAGAHVVVHSALFGLIAADDSIPAYRLSCDSRVPTLTLPSHTLKQFWAARVSALLSETAGLVLDLRSEGYAKLGPRPIRPQSFYLRVVTAEPDGHKRALNHFNKKAKGQFTRALLENEHEFHTSNELREWAHSAGIRLEPGASGELDLVVHQHPASAQLAATSSIYADARLGA